MWAIVVRQKEFALDAMQALCQPLMVLLSEGCSIIFFCPVVRRVTVKQSVGPIINPYQAFKIQMFNHDPIQTILYSREFGQHIFEAFFCSGKGSVVTSKAHLYKVKAAGSALYVCQTANVFLLRAVKEKFAGLWQHRELFGQCWCMVLNAAVNIDQFAIRVIEYLQLARGLSFSKEDPPSSAKDLNVTRNIGREAPQNLCPQLLFSTDPANVTVHAIILSGAKR